MANRPMFIDATPLIAYTERVYPEGPAAFPAYAAFVVDDSGWRRDLAAEMELLRISRALDRARKSGRITLHMADRICIEALGLHPFQVYGNAWFSDAALAIGVSDNTESIEEAA